MQPSLAPAAPARACVTASGSGSACRPRRRVAQQVRPAAATAAAQAAARAPRRGRLAASACGSSAAGWVAAAQPRAVWTVPSLVSRRCVSEVAGSDSGSSCSSSRSARRPSCQGRPHKHATRMPCGAGQSCSAGNTCQRVNQWHWQCAPSGAGVVLGAWDQCGGLGGSCASYFCTDGPFPRWAAGGMGPAGTAPPPPCANTSRAQPAASLASPGA